MDSPRGPDGRTLKSPRKISLLGATGSIGASTIDLLLRHPDDFLVEAVTAHSDALGLAQLARDTGARVAVVADPVAYRDLKEALSGSGIEAAAGPQALIEAASRPVDLMVAAIVGAAGLAPTLAAIEAGSDVALANKECLVCAGELFMEAVARNGVRLLPVDSEHNAIFQALDVAATNAVEKIVLTASGGPFLDWSADRLADATPEEAADHPNWSMGRKISVDSATLINKGLELIEAHYLFGFGNNQMDVLIHPQSIVHGLVVYGDGSVISQMSVTDMRVPLGYCLWWPDRRVSSHQPLDLAALGSLTFQEPDPIRFPGLPLARHALDSGGAATNIFNAANEIAVGAFLAGRIGYQDIVALSDRVLSSAPASALQSVPTGLEEALSLDGEGRRLARLALEQMGGRLPVEMT